MGNFFEQMQDDKQKNLEAMEQKAKEYEQVAAEIAKLKATVAELKDDIDGLKQSIGGLDSTLKTISPKDIEDFKQESMNLFKPLQDTAEAVNTKIKAAGYEATQTLRQAGERSWKEMAADGLASAIWYVLLTLIVLYAVGFTDVRNNVEYNKDRIDAIQWNQTTAHTEGNKTYSPWEMKEFHQVWDNQNTYINKTRLEAIQGDQNQK